MEIVEQHESPDKVLRLLVILDNGDWTIGFEGCDWHTHGDILDAWGYEGSPKEATRVFVDDILASRKEICVYRADGKVWNAAVPDLYEERPLQAGFAKFAAPGETMEVRYWDGRPAPG
jgi:hypothetical protein